MNDSSNKNYLSKEKYKELSQELENLKTVRRKEVAEALEYAKSLGDLSENAEYQEARENQANLEERILQIEALLKTATIVQDRQYSDVHVGSRVTIRDAKTGNTEVWEIVGSEEASLPEAKISNESPLGAALLGGKIGDAVEFSAPSGKRSFTIVKIE